MKPLKTIEFGDFIPDQPDFANPGSVNIKNVLPAAQGYREMPGATAFSDALDARNQGAITEIQNDGTVWSYAGDTDKLYRLVDAAWTDSSKSGGYSIATDVFWEFAKFGEQVIATNINDPVQAITLGGTQFADLITSTLKPQARHIGVTDDFVILGNTSEGGTVYPYRVRWSGIDDATDFDQSAVTQSDFQDLPEFGWVQRVIGFGRDAYVFQERAIRVMRYEGTPTIFRFDVAEQNRGAISPQSVVAFGQFVFYLSDDGFYMFDGASSHPIGKEKVDTFFYDDVDSQYLYAISAAIDPKRALVAWAYRSTSATVGAPVCDKILFYSWATKKWSIVETNNQFIYRDLSKGYTLDGLDAVSATLEGLPFSLDSRVWAGGLILLAGFNSDNELVNYTGSALAAQLDTTEFQAHPGQSSLVDAVRPLVEGASSTITVTPITRDKLNDAATVGSAVSLNSIGEADLRSAARFHRFRLDITGGFDHAQGVQVEAVPWGRQ